MAATPNTFRRPTERRPERSPQSFIRLVRRHAAALFNDGLSEASAGIHEAAACALLREGHELPSASRRDLRAALSDVRKLRSPAARSWRLGTALDRVAAVLSPRPQLALAPARGTTRVPHRRTAF